MPEPWGYALLNVEERKILRWIAQLAHTIEAIGDDTPLPFPPAHPNSMYTNALRRRSAGNLFEVYEMLYFIALDKRSVWDVHHASNPPDRYGQR